jgi:CheY-like chemotaxis protein/DNA-binding transcriptional regulator/RsmH inhibitor MraZ
LFLGKFLHNRCKQPLYSPIALKAELTAEFTHQGFDHLRSLPQTPSRVYRRATAFNVADPLARQLLRLILGTAVKLPSERVTTISVPQDLREFAALQADVVLCRPGYVEMGARTWSPETQLRDAEANSSRFALTGRHSLAVTAETHDFLRMSAPYLKQHCRQDVAMKKIRILVVEDQHVVREGLVAILSFQNDIEVVGEAPDGIQAVEIARKTRPDVILLDMVMPRQDGLITIPKLKLAVPEARILVLSSFAESDRVYQAIKAGALGYMLKDTTRVQLLRDPRCRHGTSPTAALHRHEGHP